LLLIALGSGAIYWLKAVGGPSPNARWMRISIVFAGLSCVTGGLAAWIARRRMSWVQVPMISFVFHAVGAFVFVHLVMVGGSTGTGSFGWTFGLWMVTAIGWVPAYFWFLAVWLLLISLFDQQQRPTKFDLSMRQAEIQSNKSVSENG
ncbi:MAG: hypothetical protein Q7T25_08990, partial [Sideroxyarcus sp.]|nr:hypothetical protein [Sideroxyarcus sp.]